MENKEDNSSFNEIKKKAEQEISKLQVLIDRWNRIFEAASLEETAFNSTLTEKEKNKIAADNLRTEIFPVQNKNDDYKADECFEWKVRYFTKMHNRAFTGKQFLNFIIQMEGEPRAAVYQGNYLTQQFGMLRYNQLYVLAKFNSANKYSFYLPPEWLTDDGLDIRQEFYPTPEEFGNLEPAKRCKAYLQILRK